VPRDYQDVRLIRESLRAAAELKAREWRPRFFHNVCADVRQHGRLLTRSVLGLIVFRFGAWALTQPRIVRAVAMKFYNVGDRFMRVLTGLHMHCTVLVGEHLHLIHAEGNVSIHPDVVLGDRVGIMHNVTIGLVIEQPGAPIIGNDVFIGTGAVILGPVLIGDNARIAANSLVIANVPANWIAIGVPARLYPRISAMKPARPQPAAEQTPEESRAAARSH
jgi:serine O-acetyltransferase